MHHRPAAATALIAIALFPSCIIPGLGQGRVEMEVAFATPDAFSGADYRVFDSEQLGFRATVFFCDPPLRHDDPYEMTDDYWMDKLYVPNVRSGYYTIRAFNAPDSKAMKVGLSGFVSATGEYSVDANAVEFLGLEFAPGSAAAKAVLLAIDRAAAARAGGLDALGFGSADTCYPDRVAARMGAAGQALARFPAKDTAMAASGAAAAGLTGVSLLGQDDARGRALMASVKADLAAAGIAVLAEDYSASADETKSKRFSSDCDIVHYRWAIRHDNVGALIQMLHTDDLDYSAPDSGDQALHYYSCCNEADYYRCLAEDNAAIIERSLFIPLGWKE